MATNTVTTEQVREAIEQFAAMVAAASVSPQTVANILEMLRNLNDQEKETIVAIAEGFIQRIRSIGIISEVTQDESQEIRIEANNGTIVVTIDANGADFSNLKKNGIGVATENQIPTVPTLDTNIGNEPSDSHTPSTKAVKTYVDANSGVGDLPISQESSEAETDEVEFANDAGSQIFVKVGSYGLKAEAYLDMQGNNVIPQKDTSIGETPSPTNLPTSKAVANYVQTHGGGSFPITEEKTLEDADEIRFEDDLGVLVGKITREGADFIALKINGQNILNFNKKPVIYNPPVVLSSNLKILDIGNSFSGDALAYVKNMLQAAGISDSSPEAANLCLYSVLRGGGTFKNWYDIYHDNDVSTSSYNISKILGGYAYENITGTSAGNDGTKFRKLIQDVKWDVIVIHQASDYSVGYEQWKSQEAGGYLIEFIRILKTFQPQASIGFLFTHVSNRQSNGNTATRFYQMCATTQQFSADYGVDFIIPAGAAVENIRASSANTTSHGFSRDNHHLAAGIGRYVASAAYFQALIAPIFNITIYGNTFRHEITQSEIDAVESEYVGDLVSVTNENADIAQISVLLAINNIYNINNPNNIGL